MRAFGILVDKAVKLRTPSVPNPRLERVNPPAARRLDEEIIEVFHHACLENDLAAASEILELVEKWHARRPYGNEQDRQRDRINARRLSGELERRRVMAGARPTDAVWARA